MPGAYRTRTRILLWNDKKNNTGKQGIVKLNICIDAKGAVVAAQYTPKGSNTGDRELIKLALDIVRKYKFSPSAMEKECGTITRDFRLKWNIN